MVAVSFVFVMALWAPTVIVYTYIWLTYGLKVVFIVAVALYLIFLSVVMLR